MSMTEPSGVYDVHDIAYCARCDHHETGEWVGDPTKPMQFLCATCAWITSGGDE